MNARKDLGFTLIEVMIVIVIIAVLAAIAIPSYQGMMQRTRRGEVITLINDLQLRLEKYRVDNADYNTYVSPIPLQTGFYTITFSNRTPTTYTITATRKAGPQANDSCGTLVLTFNAGVVNKSAATANCW